MHTDEKLFQTSMATTDKRSNLRILHAAVFIEIVTLPASAVRHSLQNFRKRKRAKVRTITSELFDLRALESDKIDSHALMGKNRIPAGISLAFIIFGRSFLARCPLYRQEKRQ